MRVIVFGKPRQRECTAVAEGFEALGAAVSWLTPKGQPGDEATYPETDVAVTFGQRLHSGAVAAEYRRRGTTVLTVDLPPMRVNGMEETHRALWLDRVNWMPEQRCDPRRLQSFNLDFVPLKHGRAVLVCGQTENDAAHGLGPAELRKWANDHACAIGEWMRVVWRPHPRCQFHLDGWPAHTMDEDLEDVLRRGWHAVVTYNSTAGLTALLHGIPVFCDPSSFYAELGNPTIATISTPRWPSIGDRLEFFSRLAHVQWTFAELASGEALAFVTNQAQSQVAA